MDNFSLRFSAATCKALGQQLYTRVSPVLCELISNSYDADADCVTIRMCKKQNKINLNLGTNFFHYLRL